MRLFRDMCGWLSDRSFVSRWWLQDCRSDAYAPEEGGDEEEQATAAIKSAQAPAFDASPQVT